MCEFKRSTEKVGLWIHPEQTKILSNQSTINSESKKRNLELKTWKSKYWQEMKAWNILVRKSRSTTKKRRKSRIVSGQHWRHSANTDKSWHRKTTCSIIVCGFSDATGSPTVCYAAGTRAPNKEHEQHIGTNEENEEIDINEMCTGLGTTTHNDVDSEVTFEVDLDEEIDTTVIEEEDWIEYINRSIGEAIEKMESAKMRCWSKTQKMKWK